MVPMVKPAFPAQINERAARLTAASVGLALATAWFTRTGWVIPLLAVGFLLRTLLGPRWSPLARLAAAIATKLWSPRLVAGTPKRFAQAIGASCLVTASGLELAGYPEAAWAVAVLVGTFAALEASTGFCVGCWVYGRLQASGVVGPRVCIDCTPPANASARAPRGGG
jgi:hypothetical protein